MLAKLSEGCVFKLLGGLEEEVVTTEDQLIRDGLLNNEVVLLINGIHFVELLLVGDDFLDQYLPALVPFIL